MHRTSRQWSLFANSFDVLGMEGLVGRCHVPSLCACVLWLVCGKTVLLIAKKSSVCKSGGVTVGN